MPSNIYIYIYGYLYNDFKFLAVIDLLLSSTSLLSHSLRIQLCVADDILVVMYHSHYPKSVYDNQVRTKCHQRIVLENFKLTLSIYIGISIFSLFLSHSANFLSD